MSTVSGILLQVSCIDDREDSELWAKIDAWMAAHEGGPFRPLVDVTDHLVVHKHPQTYVAGGGYNCFPEVEFADFVMGLPWERSDNVVLLINPEDGPTKIHCFGSWRHQPNAEIRQAYLDGISQAESGDIARYSSWSAAADDYMRGR